MRGKVMLSCVGVFLCLTPAALAERATVDAGAVERLFQSLDAATATEGARLLQSDEGFVRHAGAPPGAGFRTATPAAKGDTALLRAQSFFDGNRAAFMTPSDCVSFSPVSKSISNGRSFVHLQQAYDGYDVYAAEAVVQVGENGDIESVLSDILRDTMDLDAGKILMTPSVGAEQAIWAAVHEVAVELPGYEQQDLTAAEFPVLLIYAPEVLGLKGNPALAWQVRIITPLSPMVNYEVFVDARTGDILLAYNNIQEAKYREIYDGKNQPVDPGELVRKEGDPACDLGDANLAYDYLGDTYDFYYQHHGRDSIDDLGMTLSSTVRACQVYGYECPMLNAFWHPSTLRMYFGDGFVADDVAAHELTHGVTDLCSNLIYLGESGAISESFSDIWGEFVDLTNGKGNDAEDMRWVAGEDLPAGLTYSDMPGLRNMKDPTLFNDPDRKNSPLWIPTDWWWYDKGGVHINSGVGNKLCYLLTDGDIFNGYEVLPLGEDSDESIDRVAKLFYELQTSLLTPASDYADLYVQLAQASLNQGFTYTERLNIMNAGKAVEIAPTLTLPVSGFRATPAYNAAGKPVVVLNWTNPSRFDLKGSIVMRSTTAFPASTTDGVKVFEGMGEKALDAAVVKNVQYFYTLFPQYSSGAKADPLYARVYAGADAPDTYTEAFEVDVPWDDPQTTKDNAFDVDGFIDLSYNQITFTPIGAPLNAPNSEDFYTDYFQYTATRARVVDFPVARSDADGGATILPMGDNTFTGMQLRDPFPFFGGRYYILYVAANGFISFEPIASDSELNFPSLESHYAIPRISFLFGNLSPLTSGEIWARFLDDRVVITFAGIPEFLDLEWYVSPWPNAPWPNNVQVELFYNGQIRFTYKDVNVLNVVCGLSDGHGIPQDPADLFTNVVTHIPVSNLSELPTVDDLLGPPLTQTPLAILPVPVIEGDAGEVLRFDVKAGSLLHLLSDAIVPGAVPVLETTWDGPGVLPFVDNGDGTGRMAWTPALAIHPDVYTVRLTATAGTEVAYQDIRIHVGDPNPKPEARNVLLRTAMPNDVPDHDRPIIDETPLMVDYTYYHAEANVDPDSYAEAFPIIYWFKNNAQIPALTNHWMVPADATKPNDKWFYTIAPRTVKGVKGDTVMSPVVWVVQQPVITRISANAGPATGGETVRLFGERLNRPTSVTFGGIPVQSIRSISDTEIEVVTPAHAPGLVNIVVQTAEGSLPGYLDGAYRFADGGALIVKADVNADGFIDALDVQLVLRAVLGQAAKASVDADANRDGLVNALDVQVVVNSALQP